MTTPPYSMSFTDGALLWRESLTVSEQFQANPDWPTVRQQVISHNLLQMRTTNSSKRIYEEVKSRLSRLTPAAWEILWHGTSQEQRYILWLAVCKRYAFIRDFATSVVHEKYLRLDYTLTYLDYDIFFNDKAEWHPEVKRVADSTRAKQRQIVFQMLRQAELLTAENVIIPALLSPSLVQTIMADSPTYLTIFPITAVQIKESLS